jgi:hypothetical protein
MGQKFAGSAALDILGTSEMPADDHPRTPHGFAPYQEKS